MSQRIAFIGYGEAGRAFRRSLAGTGASFAAYDICEDAGMGEAMAEDGVARAASPETAADGAEWVFSAVTADRSLEAACAVAGALGAGQVLIDINSVSPERKRKSAAELAPGGATYIDMAVMAPVHSRGHRTPVLIAGPAAEALAGPLRDAGFALEVAGDEVGAATAVKMVRSLFVKGLEAITVEALTAAAASGCFERVLASLAASYPGLGWPEIASYHFERTLRHGARRAAEMRESAATIEALGLRGALAAEIAEVQERMGALGSAALPDGDLAAAVSEIARLRRG